VTLGDLEGRTQGVTQVFTRWFSFAVSMIMPVKVCSFNCRGLQSSVHELQLLSISFDVICLQELWLPDNELGLLNNIVSGMHGLGVSPMDASSGFMRGRPHGGVGFLCKDNLLANASVVCTCNLWSVALRLTDMLGMFTSHVISMKMLINTLIVLGSCLPLLPTSIENI